MKIKYTLVVDFPDDAGVKEVDDMCHYISHHVKDAQIMVQSSNRVSRPKLDYIFYDSAVVYGGISELTT